MMAKHRITELDDHLVVEVIGAAGFAEIAAAIREELARPAFRRLNDLWVFGPELVAVKFEDLQAFTRLIADLYPAEATRTRTALVVGPGYNGAIANMWLQTTSALPYEIRIFEDRQAAEKWVRA